MTTDELLKKATPRPWNTANMTDIFAALGGRSAEGTLARENDAWQIADCMTGLTQIGENEAISLETHDTLEPSEQAGNAALIVRAVNSFEAMRAVCAGVVETQNPNLSPLVAEQCARQIVKDAKVALKLANGEK